MRQALALLPALLSAAVLLAGCSSGGGGPVTPELKDGKYVIHMTSAQTFSPANARVPLNATVEWVDDGGVHDVAAADGSWTSGHTLQVGQTYDHTFTASGTVAYVCHIHESTGMKGTLVVG